MPGFSRDSAGRAVFGKCLISSVLQDTRVTTPAYLYDLDGIDEQAQALTRVLGPAGLVAYAVKANAAGSVLRTLKEAGVGADVVSGAELSLARAVGVAKERIVMSGVAKTDAELDLAISAEIRALQLESVEEIARVAARARAQNRSARVALRLNPGVSIATHSHVATGHDKAKFGIPLSSLDAALAQLATHQELRLVGVSTHVGSTLMETAPYLQSARVVCDIAQGLRSSGKSLEYINFGGGFGIDYGLGQPVPPSAFADAARSLQKEQGLEDHQLVIEPGRCLVGPFGALLASVIQSKRTDAGRWLMLDAGMNDLLRPALYHAHHRVEALAAPPAGEPWQVVGPVCESADDFGSHVIGHEAPSHVVVRDAGAYSFSMASNYNGRALPCEVFLRHGQLQHVTPSPGTASWVEARLKA
jgi:diaminopimelate decarboxylase